jgi:GNAT superfamily N-acetyltransferase
MSGARRLRDLWREHPIVFVSAVLYRIPFHPIRVVYFRRLELRGSPEAPVRAETTTRLADRSDLNLLVRCFDKRETFERRFASGESCLIALADGAVVGYEWFSTKRRQVEERYGYPFDIPGDALYSYDAYTSESHRDRGVWRQIMVAAAAMRAREGKERIVAHVEYGNPGSYAAHLRVGFRPIERYLFLSVLGLRFLWRTWVAPPS